MNIRQKTLSIALIAASPFVAVSAFAAPIALDQSPVVTKQTASAYSLCQAELRRRMGGARSIVSISVAESIPSATMNRLVGQGTYRRDSGSQPQQFNFSCVVNLQQSRVASLSYTFIND